MQLTIGVDVFSRMCGQKADTSSNIVTIFSHMTRDTLVFVKCDMVFRLFFRNYHKFELLTLAR